ncbi:MAG: prepilin-type N-terminal cleavage/methylation domain-containing protein [Phycisphaerae bacterium]|nr:prepilin-type N-terminal cleavage/methylation domain-containing protein [Phycisphaerae bacterium]
MKIHAIHPDPITAACARRDRGFTLVELIVAVAAVALLTVGIGQIFSSVGRLVGSGTALAETDQFARSIEGQMRADFDALSGLRSEETFLVIRNRRIGDVNRNGSIDGRERAVYLNSEAKEFDRKESIAPYARGSRAITVRLDEIMFIAAAGGDAVTSQRIPPNMLSPGHADHVRLYYGHGLRPPIDRRFNPLEPPARANGDGNVPPRLYFADGDFGVPAGGVNQYYPTGAPAIFQQAQGRNEYAGDWLLLRQPLLLAGGLAAGFAPSSIPSGAKPSEWMYSPFIRGLECVERSFNGWGGSMNDWGNTSPLSPTGPYARVLYHGRTDVCAQGLAEAKRWLEGLTPGVRSTNNPWADASAFENGLLDDPSAGTNTRWDPSNDPYPSTLIDAPLWQRIAGAAPDVVRVENHRDLISAIAGCLARFQAEDDPPLVERRDVLTSDAGSPAVDAPRPRFQQVMDMHAVIASRVSNFEIAWTDGKTWLEDTPPGGRGYDRNGDDDPNDLNADGDLGLDDNIRRGDVIWYDIDFSRFDNPDGGARDLRAADTAGLLGVRGESQIATPEVFPGQRSAMLRVTNAYPNRYDLRRTGAADPTDPDGASEYLAVFPFRRVSADGGYETVGYPKPTRIRVRMTVYDAQFRLPGGREYEFEFPIDLK